MTNSSIDIIKFIASSIEIAWPNHVEALGKIEEHIADDVIKYKAFDTRITHFIVFKGKGTAKEISFYFKDNEFSLLDLEKNLGKYRSKFNFRENYTKFSFNLQSKIIIELFFIKDNKFTFKDNKEIIENDPKGNQKILSDVKFNAFSIST